MATSYTNTYSLDLESGSSQYASIADASQAGLDLSGDFTFEAWIKPESLPATTTRTILSKYDSNSLRSYWFDIVDNVPDIRIGVTLSADGTSSNRVDIYYSGTNYIKVGEWTHIAVSCDISNPNSTKLLFYLNGVNVGDGTVASSSGTVSSLFDTSSAFAIGGRFGSGSVADPFDGLIDDVRVWSDIRTDAEIQDNMHQELVGNEANLVGYWKLNNDYLDETTNNNDLTSSGSPVFSTDINTWYYPNSEGDTYSDWTSPTNAFNLGRLSSYAFGGTGSTVDEQDYYTFRIPDLSGFTVNGIEVEVRARDSAASPTSWTMLAKLSGDGGATWTATKSQSWSATVDTSASYGGAADTWGKTWSTSEFSNSNFIVAFDITGGISSTDLDIENVRVKLTVSGGTTTSTSTSTTSSSTSTTSSSTSTTSSSTSTTTTSSSSSSSSSTSTTSSSTTTTSSSTSTTSSSSSSSSTSTTTTSSSTSTTSSSTSTTTTSSSTSTTSSSSTSTTSSSSSTSTTTTSTSSTSSSTSTTATLTSTSTSSTSTSTTSSSTSTTSSSTSTTSISTSTTSSSSTSTTSSSSTSSTSTSTIMYIPEIDGLDDKRPAVANVSYY